VVQLISRMNVTATPATLFDPARSPEPPAGDTPDLSRMQLLERIMGRNSTATEEYLGTFSDLSLSRYLARLESTGSRRGARWERPGDSPAIMVREAAL
jgi:hypothetical protein